MVVFTYQKYPQNLAFLTLRILKLFTVKFREMFVYKYTNTIDYNKMQPTF